MPAFRLSRLRWGREKGQGKPVQRYFKQAQQTKVNFHTYTRLQSLYASIQLSAFCVKILILYGQIECELHRSRNGAIQSASLLIILTFRCLFEKIYFAFGRTTWLSLTSWEPPSADYPIELSSLKYWSGHRLTVIEKFEEAQPHLGKLPEDSPTKCFRKICQFYVDYMRSLTRSDGSEEHKVFGTVIDVIETEVTLRFWWSLNWRIKSGFNGNYRLSFMRLVVNC